MQKQFKIMSALAIGLFTMPVMGNTVFAQNADDIRDGNYDVGVTAFEDGTNKKSVADDFVHDASITIDDGNPSLTLGIGADDEGDYADFDFSINWVKVEGKEPANESQKGDFTYYTFPLNSLNTKIPAEMKYVVPDFPPLEDGHEVDFDLKLDGLNELPEKPETGKVKVTYVDQNGDQIAESETLEGDVGSAYETEQKKVDGYNFVEVNGDASGEFAEDSAAVEYVYEEENEGNQNENGDNNEEGNTENNDNNEGNDNNQDEEKAPDDRKTGDLLTQDEADAVYQLNYETDSKATASQLENPVKLLEKDNKQYVQISINENGAQFFRSLKINGEEVTWNSTNNSPYKIQFELPGDIDDELNLSMVIQAGPKVMSHDVTISFDEDSLETIKAPEEPAEQSEVQVDYIDQNGEKLADSETLKGEIGTSYETEQKNIDGYNFVEVNGDEAGDFSGNTATVEYVYETESQESKQEETSDDNKDNGSSAGKNDDDDSASGSKESSTNDDSDGSDPAENNNNVNGSNSAEDNSSGYDKLNGDTNSSNHNGDNSTANPKTGDTSSMILYSLLLIISGVPLAFLVKRRFV